MYLIHILFISLGSLPARCVYTLNIVRSNSDVIIQSPDRKELTFFSEPPPFVLLDETKGACFVKRASGLNFDQSILNVDGPVMLKIAEVVNNYNFVTDFRVEILKKSEWQKKWLVLHLTFAGYERFKYLLEVHDPVKGKIIGKFRNSEGEEFSSDNVKQAGYFKNYFDPKRGVGVLKENIESVYDVIPPSMGYWFPNMKNPQFVVDGYKIMDSFPMEGEVAEFALKDNTMLLGKALKFI